MNTRAIRLDLISLEEGTQQRPLDEDVVSRYLSLMADGTKCSPVEAVSDGVNFWLWDGFHRCECAYRRGDKTIAAYVAKGTLRDAIWLSFSANRDHGLPRQRGVAQKIVEQILTDKAWAKKSLSAIARHVGVTQGYVSQIKGNLSAHGISTNTIGPRSGAENEDSPADPAPQVERDEPIEVERAGTTYTQKSRERRPTRRPDGKDNASIPAFESRIDKINAQSRSLTRQLMHLRSQMEKYAVEELRGVKVWLAGSAIKQLLAELERIKLAESQELAPEGPLQDMVGRVIPEHLRELYNSRDMIRRYVNDLQRLKRAVTERIDARDPALFRLNTNAFQVHFENLPRTLKAAMPHAVCLYCGGDAEDCRPCKGYGLLSKLDYEAAPKELKA